MPEISRFFGIVITMYHREHGSPHFHVWYSGMVAVFDIGTVTLRRGNLPPRVTGLVTEWALLHQNELMQNWQLARQDRSLNRIEPLT